jgi:urease accessory protein
MIRTKCSVLSRQPLRLMMALPLAGLLLMIPKLASAHVGFHDGSGFGAGLGHPVGGADHVLAMVMVGIWAALSGGRAVWAMPATFLSAMLMGGGLGLAGVPLPGVEPVILASIIILGAAAGLAWRPPLLLALAGVAVFGIAHGHAHGAEGSAEFGYAAGFMLSTALLHLVGLALGFGLIRAGQGVAARAVGGGAAVAGLVLALR